MAERFERTFHVRWGDMDFNAHMRNTAYLDVCGDVRMMFFESRGFSMREFERRKLGPVIQKDELEYYREMRLLEKLRVDLQIAGHSADGSRFCLRNEFYREDGKRVARVTSTGGWLDLEARKLAAPPAELLALMNDLPLSDDFREMPSGLRA